MRIERWNCGTMRRYHFPSGAIGVVSRNQFTGKRLIKVIPAFCRHIAVDCSAADMLEQLRAARTSSKQQEA